MINSIIESTQITISVQSKKNNDTKFNASFFFNNLVANVKPAVAEFNVNSLYCLLNSLVLIMKESGLRTSFEGMNLTEPAINRMLEFVEWERLLKSPTVFNRQSVKEIFMQLL